MPRTKTLGIRPRGGLFTLLALGWTMLALQVSAVTITATLDRSEIAAQEAAYLTVTVAGGNGHETPRIPEVNGLTLQPRSRQMAITSEGGRPQVSVVLQYYVRPLAPGTYSIGPVSVTTQNREYSAPAITLTVLAPGQAPSPPQNTDTARPAFLVLPLPRPEVYVGETVVLEPELYALGGEIRQAPQLSADGGTLGRVDLIANEGGIRTNNAVYARVRYRMTFTPARTGDLTLYLTNGVVDMPTRPRRPGIGDMFEMFGFAEQRRYELSSTPVVLRVRPLPSKGVPAGFQGAVGDFDLSLSASPTNVLAGYPITVRLSVRGAGNFDSVQLADAPEWSAFRLYPPTSTFEPADKVGFTGTKTFEQVVTPEKAGIPALPPRTFVFFSPTRESYRTLRTPAIPLQVGAGSASPSLPEVPEAAPETANAPQGPAFAPLRPHLGQVVIPAPPALTQPWFLGLTGLPFAVWAGLAAWQRVRARAQRDPAARAFREARSRIHRDLSELSRLASAGDADGFHTTLFRVLQEAVGARIGVPAAAITEGDLDAGLAGSIGPALRAEIHALFQACNQARYAGATAPADLAALLERTRAVLAPLGLA